MLVARRDPPFESGAHDNPHLFPGAHAGHVSRAPRLVTILQMCGSLLAIPVGLASAYSVYHSNFSDAAQCQGLRANIISMLDKSADASTLRMLVRRDVLAFEATCGKVDPDAVAAFKTLLAAQKRAAPAQIEPPQHAARETAHKSAETPKPLEAAKSVEAAKPVEAAKTFEAVKPIAPKAAPAVTQAKPLHRDTAASDADWVASVREALIHSPEARGEAAHPLGSMPVDAVARPVLPRSLPQSLPQAAAPPLPPATSVAATPPPASATDHPVPPGTIPDQAPAKPASTGSGGWLAKIPILNRIVGQ
jgi:hypothetical protein